MIRCGPVSAPSCCLLIASLTVVLLPGRRALGAGPGAPPAWKSDPRLAKQLAPEAVVGDFAVRPPAGYTLQKRPGPGGSQGFAWAGPERPDGARAYLLVVIAAPPAGAQGRPTAE